MTCIVLLSYLDRLGASEHMLLSGISFIMLLLNVVLLLELACVCFLASSESPLTAVISFVSAVGVVGLLLDLLNSTLYCPDLLSL